jgi:RNA polymerase sigma-70 factor (ECF subfamily)
MAPGGTAVLSREATAPIPGFGIGPRRLVPPATVPPVPTPPSSVALADGSDALLAARLAAGDDSALEEAFASLGSRVHAAARRVLGNSAPAEDVVQDVFVGLWMHPEQFDAARGSLRTYLCLAAHRRAIDLVRSELRRCAREDSATRLLPAQRDNDEELTGHLVAGLVREAVRRLPDDQGRVIELAYFHGQTYREVARTLGIPEGTAKSRLRLGLARLETYLDRSLVEPS